LKIGVLLELNFYYYWSIHQGVLSDDGSVMLITRVDRRDHHHHHHHHKMAACCLLTGLLSSGDQDAGKKGFKGHGPIVETDI
jgi:hypothetical protein